jgi:Cupin-like domain
VGNYNANDGSWNQIKGSDVETSSIEPLTQGAVFDAALQGTRKALKELAHKRLWPHKPQLHSLVGTPTSLLEPLTIHARRKALFAAAAEGLPILLPNVQVPVAREAKMGVQSALLRAIARAFRAKETASAQVGRRGARRVLPIPELLRRWQRNRHTVSITDLHVRNTTLERDIDTSELSGFNLLPLGTESMRRQEMMTLVMSSRANVTDSHSDDPDGSNHCFVGRKLWLAWETFEGRKAGLQDCSRDDINDRARFDLTAFASLKSAKWWTVGPGETLFLPGRFSHRVITLERYLGIGSFYCTPSSCLENLSRWYDYGALWSLDDPEGDNQGLTDEIAIALVKKLRHLAEQTSQTQEKWGLDFASLGFHHWQRHWTTSRRNDLLRSHPHFAKLVREFEEMANTQSA